MTVSFLLVVTSLMQLATSRWFFDATVDLSKALLRSFVLCFNAENANNEVRVNCTLLNKDMMSYRGQRAVLNRERPESVNRSVRYKHLVRRVKLDCGTVHRQATSNLQSVLRVKWNLLKNNLVV